MAAIITSLSLISRFVLTAFPLVKEELAGWRCKAAVCPDKELTAQLASIADKTFHCQGGSVYGLYPGADHAGLIRFITALQTISDYLDNLCDRAGVYDEAAFAQLHVAMTDALDPDRPAAGYYDSYPLQDDGGYLAALVGTCREQVALLPAYGSVKAEALELARLYSCLQRQVKHLAPAVREERMLAWIEPCLAGYPDLTPWEFAAATGSTLGIFMLCAAASAPDLTPRQATEIKNSYFPYITGLHILLDYFIDGAEDRLHGDLNFVEYYGSPALTASRLALFTRQAFAAAGRLPAPAFHRTVVAGLLAMYLSDPKTDKEPEKSIKKDLLRQAGSYTKLLYMLCQSLRAAKIL